MTKNKIFFLVILILAAFFRFWQLDELPLSPNWDEISHGYNAFSLLKTGRDQWGSAWPLFNFRAYGDYPTALNLYLTLPFVALLGLNTLSLRLPAAILGLVFTVVVYFLARIFTKNRSLSLIAFAIAAFSPWTFFTSRAVFQSNPAQFFLSLGILLFLLSKNNNKNYQILSALSLGLSLYSYHNSRIAAPLIFLSLLLIYRQFNKKNLLFIIVFLILAVPNLINLFSPESLVRNRWVGIINPISVNIINERRRLFEGPVLLNLLANNKVTYFGSQFTSNLLNFLNPVPLFFTGSQNYQFNPPQTGLLYIFLLPFFYLGLIVSFKKVANNRHHLFLVVALLISFIPAALTTGDFPSVRLTIATPFIYLFITIGFSTIAAKTKGYLLPLFLILTLTFFFNYWKNYQNYAQNYASAWQYGHEETVNYLKSQYPQYDQIVFTKKYGEPHQFILFYWPWDPASYHQDPKLNTDFHSDWYWVNAFDKFVFVNDWEIKNYSFKPRTLLVTSPGNYPCLNSQLQKTINYPDLTPVFDIVSYD